MNTNIDKVKAKQEADHDDDNNDDADEDHVMMRNLFSTESSDNSDNSGSHHGEKNATTTTAEEEEEEYTFCELNILNVKIRQQTRGGSIAQRLWPAAQYLANFIQQLLLSNNHDNNDSFETTTTTSQQRQGQHEYNNNDVDVKRQIRQRLVKWLKPYWIHDDDEMTPSRPLIIVELGAGVGLTGLQLATQFRPCRVLLTDLPEAMTLLNTNIQLNTDTTTTTTFHHAATNNDNSIDKKKKQQQQEEKQSTTMTIPTDNIVQAAILPWGGTLDDGCQHLLEVLEWIQEEQQIPADLNQAGNTTTTKPCLFLASDCVYHAHLHLPLEITLAQVLKNKGNICLLASVKRWKRDGTFFQSLGRHTRTQTHSLVCTLLYESVTMEQEEEEEEDDGLFASSGRRRRQVMRIHAVEWKRRSDS